jgi:NAD(P)-dependent dehydrogenase (short-subunit alcohol dehydrogenase family)
MNFEGKVAVVTGAGAGIGQETALRFAAQREAVAMLDVNGLAAEQTARTILDQGGRGLPIRADVSSERDVAEAFRQVGETLGPVAILANIADVELYKDFLDFEPSEWDSQIAVNQRSVYLCSRAAIRS